MGDSPPLNCQQWVFWITFRGDLKATEDCRMHLAASTEQWAPQMCHIVLGGLLLQPLLWSWLQDRRTWQSSRAPASCLPSGVLQSLQSLPVCFLGWIFPVQWLRWQCREQNALIKLSRCPWAKCLFWKMDPPIFYATKHLKTHDAECSQ